MGGSPVSRDAPFDLHASSGGPHSPAKYRFFEYFARPPTRLAVLQHGFAYDQSSQLRADRSFACRHTSVGGDPIVSRKDGRNTSRRLSCPVHGVGLLGDQRMTEPQDITLSRPVGTNGAKFQQFKRWIEVSLYPLFESFQIYTRSPSLHDRKAEHRSQDRWEKKLPHEPHALVVLNQIPSRSPAIPPSGNL